MDYWIKQTIDKPQFEEILWSRPENRNGAGKLLIIGGSEHGFSAVGEAYQTATESGAGTVKAIMPDGIRKHIKFVWEDADFVPSTISGSFAVKSLNELLMHASWADMVLIAGDLERNSETAMLLEKFIEKYSGPLTITKDAVDYFTTHADFISQRENTTLVLSLSQLQKLGTTLKFESPFLLSMGMVMLAQALHSFTDKHSFNIITKELDSIVVGSKGRVSSTKLKEDQEIWRVKTSAKMAVFWMQNPAKPFEAMTTSLTI